MEDVHGIAKGAQFALERKKQPADLTREMLADGSWRAARPSRPTTSCPAPALSPRAVTSTLSLKVRQQFRETFLQLGFAEMLHQQLRRVRLLEFRHPDPAPDAPGETPTTPSSS